MHLNRIDLNLLVALDALLTDQNVTRAAERIHISQPAMSGALQRLRTQLNDALLEPAGYHRMTLTPRARRIAAEVKELVHRIQSTLTPQPDFEPSNAALDIQVAMSSYCAQVIGTRLIAEMRHKAPKIRCRIYEQTENSLAGVTHGDLDFCLTVAQRSVMDPSNQFLQLRAQAVFADRFVIVADADNEEVKRSLTIDKYRLLPSIEVRFYGDVLSVVERALLSFGQSSNNVAIVSSFYLALAAVSRTSMVTIVPALLAQAVGEALNLKWYEPQFKLPELHEALLWHERNDAEPSHVWFREQVGLAAAKMNYDIVHTGTKREGALNTAP